MLLRIAGPLKEEVYSGAESWLTVLPSEQTAWNRMTSEGPDKHLQDLQRFEVILSKLGHESALRLSRNTRKYCPKNFSLMIFCRRLNVCVKIGKTWTKELVAPDRGWQGQLCFLPCAVANLNTAPNTIYAIKIYPF